MDDDGNVYMTSRFYLEQLLADKMSVPFVLLNRLPLKAAEGRFKKSPLWDPQGIEKKDGLVGEQASQDVFSKKGSEAIRQANNYSDDKVIL